MVVGVDHAGQDDHPPCVDHRIGRFGQLGGRTGLDDRIITDEQVVVGDAPPLGIHRDQRIDVFEE